MHVTEQKTQFFIFALTWYIYLVFGILYVPLKTSVNVSHFILQLNSNIPVIIFLMKSYFNHKKRNIPVILCNYVCILVIKKKRFCDVQ